MGQKIRILKKKKNFWENDRDDVENTGLGVSGTFGTFRFSGRDVSTEIAPMTKSFFEVFESGTFTYDTADLGPENVSPRRAVRFCKKPHETGQTVQELEKSAVCLQKFMIGFCRFFVFQSEISK